MQRLARAPAATPPIALPATDLVIDHVLHEVRRALRGPVPRLSRGDAAAPQAIASGFGWLEDYPGQRWMLQITASGLKALAAHQAGTR